MFSTLVIAAVFLVVIVLGLVVWGFLLHVGLRWARAENCSVRRVVAVTVFCQVVLSLLMLPLAMAIPQNKAAAIGVGVVSLILPVLVTWAVIARVFRLRSWRAVQAWLPTLLSVVVTLPLLLGLVRPFLMEAFTVPTNSMAPTLLGRHCQGTCEVCGSTTYGTPVEEYERSFSRGIHTICGKCFHMASDQPVAGPVYGSDRFLVSKFLKPRRWDLVVFRYPEDPSTFYVKRLVGLPGETIFIDQGKVWVNGKTLDTPEYLQGLQYVSKFPGMWMRLSGTKDRPAPLGADEYFVLGDFSSQAKDSRLWQRGAEGHPPYAVPESYMVGVVTHIYWPPSRMRILR